MASTLNNSSDKKYRTFLIVIFLLSIGLPCTMITWARLGNTPVKEYLSLQGKTPFPPGLKILVLADIHLNENNLKIAIDEGLKEHPDFCVFLGDLCTGGQRFKNVSQWCTQFKRLTQENHIPVYAIWGNHDYEFNLLYPHIMQESGITLLRNQSATFNYKGKLISIVGLGDWSQNDCSPQKVLTKKRQNDSDNNLPILLLEHNPEARIDLTDYPWHFMLCGHTHGGQIGIFNIGPRLLCSDPHFAKGLKYWDNRPLYINRGLGSHLGLRLNCPPEYTIITF